MTASERKPRRLIDVKNPWNLRRDRPLEEESPQPYRGARSTEGIYFIRFDRYIKIGYGKTVSARQKAELSHGEGHGQFGHVIAVVHGTKDDERQVHKYFNAFRFDVAKRELFYHAVELTDYVRWLRKQSFVEAGDDERWRADGIVRDMQPVDSMGWLPAPERREEHIPELFSQNHDIYIARKQMGDDYYTPDGLMALVRKAMGGNIDLDPASHAIANARINANRIYTKSEDGTKQPWFG